MPFFCGHGIGEYFHGPPSILHISKFLLFFCLDISNYHVYMYIYQLIIIPSVCFGTFCLGFSENDEPGVMKTGMTFTIGMLKNHSEFLCESFSCIH